MPRLLVVDGMKRLLKILRLAFLTIPSVRLDLKALHSAFCIWEVREGISAEEFQEFIDGPMGVNFGLGAWMNICREIDLELAGNAPYPRKF